MKKVLLGSLAILFGSGLFAQSRSIDLSVEEILEPTEIRSTLQGTSVTMNSVIKNNSSTDTVKVGDTLIFQAAIQNMSNQTLLATQLLFRLATAQILPGDTQHFRMGFSTQQYIINSTRVNLLFTCILANRPNLPIDANANNTFRQAMDWINPNGFGVSVAKVSKGVLRTYPNPVKDEVNVELPLQTAGAKTKVEITDITGKVVMKAEFNEFDAIKMNVSSLKTGVYTMKVTNGEKTFTSKVTKS